jgi:hypothetical protein
MLTSQNLTILSAEALLTDLERLLAGTPAWPVGSALGLVRAGVPVPPDAAQAAALLDELVARDATSALPHDIRERFLLVYDEFRRLLPEATMFFDRHRIGLRKMRARSVMLRRVAERRAERRAKALQKIGIDVHPDDVDVLRAFANELLRKRNIEPVALKRARSRSQKAPAPASPTPAPAPAAGQEDHDPLGPYFTPRKHP